MWFQIDVGYACFGLKVEGGVVTDAAPIAAWAIGKKADYVFNYFRKNKRGIITSLSKGKV